MVAVGSMHWQVVVALDRLEALAVIVTHIGTIARRVVAIVVTILLVPMTTPS